MNKSKPSGYGYALVSVAFWSLVLYFCVTVAGSLLRSNYGGPPDLSSDPHSYGYKWCVERIANSQALLENHLMHTLQHGHEEDAGAWRSWRQQWDSEVQQNTVACQATQSTSVSAGFARLHVLAGRYDAVAQSMADAQAEQRGLHEQIRQLNLE